MEKKIVKKQVSLTDKAKKEKAAKVKAGPRIAFGMHDLRAPKGAHKPRKIKGRGAGSGHGKTSTRGSKGQTSRAGRDMYPGFEGGQTPLIRRMPKRGFTHAGKKVFQLVNVVDLARIKDAVVSPEVLEAKGLIKDKNKLVKVLGNGELKAAQTVQAHAFSRQAFDKIQKAGGKAEIVAYGA